MDDYKNKRKRVKSRTTSKNYVDYVVQDCPIMGTRVVRHFINEEKQFYNFKAKN